ncbi:gamma-tubulin complex component 2 homolog isoform X2 [Toxorhynchites rutilus septentrionalis]|uniref:gamma-tubulin complex component 2 homolog isoform X2 n=1 Tax=Toxorhynchites rutilus septentrionalis TaxID=329112 RepID=UPI0024791BB3|nr:gamma-tubulin complex component 2 homolog isoform X2 [Toxorhynchites rutilus septentrionalis]
MSEVKAKKILSELVKKSGCTYSADNILTIFRNKDAKYSNRRLGALLTQLFKTTPNGAKYVDEFVSSNPKDSYTAFIFLLNTFIQDCKNDRQLERSVPPPPAQPESVSKRAAIFESPPLSSTRIVTEQVTPETVQEIKEKLVQATIGAVANRSSTSIPATLVPQPYDFVHKKGAILSWNFFYDELYPMQNKNVTAIPLSSQEPIVLKELLDCLVGVKGSLISPKKTIRNGGLNPVEFDVSDQIEESLKDIIREILPLASHYSQVQDFIAASSSLESGQLLQALRAALQSIINDYYLSITRLEDLFLKQQLTLHKLLYFLRPVFHTMEVLAETVTAIRQSNSRGGSVLTLLHDKITSTTGDEKSQKVLIHLIEMAAVPYMEMLHLWMFDGVIHDPRKEFLVEHNVMDLNENELMDYWEKQYTTRLDEVPCFLNKYADVILRTGKYLNVIRECGNSADYSQRNRNTLKYSHTDQMYITAIEDAYNFASSSLLNLIMDKYDLMGRLYSVKRYFLLQQGDFISQFMDACEEDLNKDVDNLRPMRLENLLEVTLNMSSARYDEYNDDLKTMLLPYGILTQISKIVKKEDVFLDTLGDTSQLKGIECFTFSYNAQWPVSIVLNRLTISKYQMIFRQLFYLKHVERILCRVWIANNRTKQFAPQTAKLYRSAFTLRQKMLIAMQNFESYMMIEVIEPNWHIFYQNIKQIKNVDDVLNYHQEFLDQCMKNCMLTEPDLLKSIISLCNICIQFCGFLEEVASTMEPTETFSERVEKFHSDFTNQLLSLLRKITDVATQNPSDKFINLIHRINFNSYYSDNFDF